MAKNIVMPQMGFDMTEGTIAGWLKAEGDKVTKGEAIAEIETDKTTIQIEAFESGVLRKIVAAAGEKVPVGATIGIIGSADEVIAAAGGALAPVASAAAAVAVAAPVAVPVAAAPAANGRIVATPVAKRIAEERGIDLRQVTGTGPEGRITKSDVENFAPAPGAPKAVPAAAPVAAPAAAPVAAAPSAADAKIAAIAAAAAGTGGAVAGQRVPLSRMRQTIAQRMVASKTQVPHVYIRNAVEMDAALSLRQQINDSLKAEGVKISVNDMVVRAVALALKKFPGLNSSFMGDAVQSHADVNVGVAVTVPDGLVTVTVKNTDAKSLRQISSEVVALAGRARDGKMQPGDYGGQTFTISNLGMYGVDDFTAIINQPDSGILAVSAAKESAVVRDHQIVIRTMMNITLSLDHRTTDGAEGAQFVAEIKRLLEAPWALVL